MNKLQKLAQECPFCCLCGTPNYDGNQLVLAHSNALQDGRGFAHKAKDLFSSYLCYHCHDNVDGRVGGWSKERKRQAQKEANAVMLRWLIENDHLGVI